MKKCPNCQNTYDDSLKFCQKDGTPLVVVAEDAPEDPFKTMVAKKEDLAPPPEETKPEPEPEPELDPFATMVAGSKMPEPTEEDVLEVPETPVDPMATMVVSGSTSGKIDVEIPEEVPSKQDPAAEPETPVDPAPEEIAPEIREEVPSDPAPAEPVAEEPASLEVEAPKEETPSKPIPSPFDESMPPGFDPPKTPPFEPVESPVEPVRQEPEMEKIVEPEPLPTDFGDVEEAEIEPAIPESSVPAPAFGQEMEPAVSSSPAIAGEEGASQTLAIIALVLGILSIFCCAWFIPGIAAIIVGFIARNKANNEPENYGGGNFATIGMVLGGISVALGIVVSVVWLVFGGLGSMM